MFGGSDTRAWPTSAKPVAQVRLVFDAAESRKTIANFSAGTRIGNSLFVAADEHVSVERLTPNGGDWGNHVSIDLAKLLKLDSPEEEADLEGLAVDDGWLWVLGSHARTRPKPEKAEHECIDLEILADLKDTRPRCLLARLPLVQGEGGLMPVKKDGSRHAGMISQGKYGGALAKALKQDPLLRPFTHVPAKEGGIDIEGIAVCGDRVALGMRGPVITGHALLLELQIAAKSTGRLHFAQPPTKRLLAMEGLGIRDLKRCDDDLLILAGPTTGLSGPCALYRWRDWVLDPAQDERKVRLHRPERLFDIPFGRGVDHPEGLALWNEGGKRQILVIYDSPSKARLDKKRSSILADLFDLPD